MSKKTSSSLYVQSTVFVQIHGTLHMYMSAYFMRVAGSIISPLYCQQNYSQNAPKGTTERPKFQNFPGGAACPHTPPTLLLFYYDTSIGANKTNTKRK